MSRDLTFTDLIKFVYTHNPFYLLSACLFLYGLHVAFPAGEIFSVDPWSRMKLLCGYITLMAVTAYLVVRLGKVWEDARSILLVMLLLFLALSVSFDEIVSTMPDVAGKLLICGFCFSIAISEGLIRGLKIAFPTLFRVPYYMILALFFAYPLWVSPEVTEQTIGAIATRVFLFPSAAAVLFLGLIPAVRRGRGYVEHNGTPWTWPAFPWVVFGFLGFAVCVRAYVMALLFTPTFEFNPAFGFYYLVPFALAVLLIILEIGIVEKNVALQRHVLEVAPLALLLAIPRQFTVEPAYERFLMTFVQTVGSPIWLAILALIAFYALAWMRGMRSAERGLTALLLLALTVGPNTVSLRTLSSPAPWPLIVLGVLHLYFSFRRGSSLRGFVGVGCLTIALSLALRQHPALYEYRFIGPYHLLLAAVLVIGGLYHDRFAGFLRGAGAVLLAVSCCGALLFGRQTPTVSPWLVVAYIGSLALVALGYAYAKYDRRYLATFVLNLGLACVATLWSVRGTLEQTVNSRGTEQLTWAAIFFLIATLISAFKGGLVNRMPQWMLPPPVLPDNQGEG